MSGESKYATFFRVKHADGLQRMLIWFMNFISLLLSGKIHNVCVVFFLLYYNIKRVP